MKIKSKGLLASIFVAMFMLCAVAFDITLVPTQTAKAEDTRIKVSNFVITSPDFAAPEHGAQVKGNKPSNAYDFNFVEGAEAYFAKTMGYWTKVNEVGLKDTYTEAKFVDGSYYYCAQLRIDSDNGCGTTHVLADEITVTVNGIKWSAGTPTVNETYSFVSIYSPTYVVEPGTLQFADNALDEIPACFLGEDLSYGVAGYVEGGKYPLTFSKVSGPDWITVSEDGRITGEPTSLGSNSKLKVRVTDARSHTADLTIKIGNTYESSTISQIVATSNLETPSYDASIAHSYKFTMEKGAPAQLMAEKGVWKRSYNTGSDWTSWQEYTGDVFTTGRYQYVTELRIDDSLKQIFDFDDSISIEVDGETWTYSSLSAPLPALSYCTVYSPIYVIEEPEYKINVGGTTLKSGEYLANGATTPTTQVPTGGYAYYNKGVLTLNNYKYNGAGLEFETDYYAGIYSDDSVKLVLVGENEIALTQEDSFAVLVNERDLTIEGNGSLTLTADYGFYACRNVNVTGGETSIVADDDGIFEVQNLTAVGGKLDVTASGYGIIADGDITLNGATVTVVSKTAYGVWATNVTATNSVLNVTAEQTAVWGKTNVTFNSVNGEIVSMKSGAEEDENYCAIVGNFTFTGCEIKATTSYAYTPGDYDETQLSTYDYIKSVKVGTTHTVTLPTGEGYEVKPTTGYSVTVADNGDFAFTVEAKTGYVLKGELTVKANGEVLTAVGGVYAIKNITEDINITVEGTFVDTSVTYTVTLPTGEGYEVKPLEGYSTTVVAGLDFKFKVEIKEGYAVAVEPQVKANGFFLDPDEEGVYTIKNIQEDKAITVGGVLANVVFVGGVTMTDGSYLATGALETTATQPDSGGYAYLKDGTLTLVNYDSQGRGTTMEESSLIAIVAMQPLTIRLVGENVLQHTTSGYGVYVLGDLTIEGDGSLMMVKNIGMGIACSGSFTMNSSTITIESAAIDAVAALMAYGNITIAGGTLNVTSVGAAVVSMEGDIFIEAGTLQIKSNKVAGLYADKGKLEMTGGNVTVNSVNGVGAKKAVTISGGVLTVTAKEVGIASEQSVYIKGDSVVTVTAGTNGIYTESFVFIYGGKTTVVSEKIGIYVETQLCVEGGMLDVSSTTTEEDAAYYAIVGTYKPLDMERITASTEADGALGEFVLSDIQSYDRVVIEFPDVYIGEFMLFEGDYLANGASVTTREKPTSGGYAYYGDGKLTLCNFEFSGTGVELDTDLYGLVFSFGDLKIVLEGENTLTQTHSKSFGISCYGDISLTGNAQGCTLHLSAGGIGIISENGDITLINANVTVTAVGFALSANNVTVNGGSMDVKSTSSEATLYAVKGNLSVVSGMDVQAALSVDGELIEYNVTYHIVYDRIVVSGTTEPAPDPDPGVTPDPDPDPGVTPDPDPDPGVTPDPDPDPGVTSDPTPDSSEEKGAIVAIVAGSVAALGVGGFALVWFVIKKKSFADLIAIFKK